MKDHILGPGTVEWLGTQYRTILPRAATGGAMAIFDSVGQPGSGPPRHIHHDADETFVMLTGEAEFWSAGETLLRGPGETVFVPRGTSHTFRVVGEQPSRHLVILSPGGFEDFFPEMADQGLRIPEDMEQIVATAARYNLEFTGPPLGAEG
ncbi:cupin domain-containing protein [Roseivivax sp. GX 12232]|uniref:cupin domain-containing protein n=1 Tax=Roseivivax sp. GX 12232 TaxID=2900547 RepID=UPI001E5A7C8F|nr:cupin domain-containing protein [Roseivivax sp. GX 12232]MCE0505535.1 cupin domain-containing protein [Roseivivax sp. GX 12232]